MEDDEKKEVILVEAPIEIDEAETTAFADLKIGTTIDSRYKVVRLLGRGGMGSVYEVLHLGLDKQMAVKVIHPFLMRDQQARVRFMREAQTASKIRHPNILEVTDVAKDSQLDLLYLATELLEGKDLDQKLQAQSRLSEAEAIKIALEICNGVEAAHKNGVVHRDLKPENVFITKDGQIKILDFGIAKITDPANISLTKTDAIIGSSCWMSPEQGKGMKSVSTPTDVWAVGVILYQMVSGSLPFDGDSPTDVVIKVVRDEPPALVGVSAKLAAVIKRAMAKEAAARPTVQELMALLKTACKEPLPERISLIATEAEPRCESNAVTMMNGEVTRELQAAVIGGSKLRKFAPMLAVMAIVPLLAVITVVTLNGRNAGRAQNMGRPVAVLDSGRLWRTPQQITSQATADAGAPLAPTVQPTPPPEQPPAIAVRPPTRPVTVHTTVRRTPVRRSNPTPARRTHCPPNPLGLDIPGCP